MPAPEITQEEILRALGLEIAKIRIIDIPPGKPVTVELVEATEKPVPWRRIAHLSVTPATTWIELLISAHKQPSACSQFDITINHESPIFWEWPIDIEKRFGTGRRAIPVQHRSSLLNFGSSVYRYEGQRLQIATFRLRGDKAKKHYMINLNAYPEPVQSNPKR